MSKLSLNNTGKSGKRSWFSLDIEGSTLFLIVIFMTIGASFYWAHSFEVDKVVRVSGKIIPAGRSRQIQHFEGGIVSSIATYEGAIVKEGDLLMTIEDSNAEALLKEKKLKLSSLLLKAKRLEAEVKGGGTLQLSGHNFDQNMADEEQRLFEARKSDLENQIRVYEGIIRQQTAALKEAKVKSVRLSEELILAKKRSKMYAEMAKKHAASRIEVLDAQSREQHLKTELSNALNSVPKFEAAIEEAQAQKEKKQTEFRSDAQKELVFARADIKQIQTALDAARDRKKRTEVRSPMDGVINRLATNTIGAVVKPGQAIVELTPCTDGVLIEARALPRDRGDLNSETPAIVRISSYDAASLGTLQGSVTEVSADTMPDSSGKSYYRVKIKIDDIPESYHGRSFNPGMMASADLVTGRRTILSYLLSPLHKYTNAMFRNPK